MKILFIFISIICLFNCMTINHKHITNNHKDCESYYDNSLNINIYTKVDEYPVYPGGFRELLSFFQENFIYPSQKEIQGSINIYLIIDIEGNIIDKGIKDKEIKDYTLVDIEALKVFDIMPKWESGKCNGSKVVVKFYVPIKF